MPQLSFETIKPEPHVPNDPTDLKYIRASLPGRRHGTHPLAQRQSRQDNKPGYLKRFAAYLRSFRAA